MPKRSYAETINSAKLMVSGLRSNADRVAKRGLTPEFTNGIENLQNKGMTLDNEQEDLKAKLKTKTEELDRLIEELEKLLSEARKIVKLEMEQSTWKSFGIDDKK
jgi:predicted RNase H-like nuclease (RuvC/YqgF family)